MNITKDQFDLIYPIGYIEVSGIKPMFGEWKIADGRDGTPDLRLEFDGVKVDSNYIIRVS